MSISITINGLPVVQTMLGKFEALPIPELMETIGGVVESQTRRRIASEKTDVDGKPWKAWSPRYARHARAGGSLLQRSGRLLDSITYKVEGDDSVRIGSNLVYARTHQEGRGGIPARPFLGVSESNQDELQAVLDAWIQNILK
ncbi:MAG: phage virion morphogenesis protein [Verrucomicrobiota bacterium]|nr:phage virion morphogenesis protein [Verrucomicrobiota bacterium]